MEEFVTHEEVGCSNLDPACQIDVLQAARASLLAEKKYLALLRGVMVRTKRCGVGLTGRHRSRVLAYCLTIGVRQHVTFAPGPAISVRTGL